MNLTSCLRIGKMPFNKLFRSGFTKRPRGILFGVICVIALFSALQIFSTVVLTKILQDARNNVIATESLRQQQAVMDKARMELLMASDKLNRAGIYYMQDKETGSVGSWNSLMEESLGSLAASQKAFTQFEGMTKNADTAATELKASYQMFYDGLREQAAGLQKNSNIDTFFEVPIQAFQDDFSQKYYAYLAVNEHTAVSLSDRLLNALTQAKTLFMGALVLLAVIAVLVWRGVSAWIIRPLQRMIGHISVLAAGDLSRDVKDDQARVIEVRELGVSLRNMQRGLQKLVSEVRDASSHIMLNINQMAKGNEELSAQAAIQSEELRAATEHITHLNERVKENAAHAQQASQRAGQAKGVATRGGEVMGQVDTAMKEIVSQSSEMSSIVSMIDSVAFQTNILALNAAIEAAHAGQHGRGFAVVAKEIGLLAQKSSHSTRGIHQLIDDSVQQISRGSASVTVLSQSLEEIISIFNGLSTLVKEISEATQYQGQSVHDVSERITALNHLTLQNGKLADHAAASSQQLLEQSQRLEKAVARFALTAA
ncbi:methyl-accepting chemotaxis protein I [Rahnella aquatilis CIP 78.65 = ATCC 33071]|uniref:Methyl-accepting chemotaxis protein n=1 Tax=Rahnella aquatilis (strain ATCC 33071 / DSM 4594 / JCM 1683 / NBRC 105701 / NCIMB 13365 / CIP 78.65) TaxID=745277 RepID=H2ISC5_RAHAC|nr:methyl-accepting chemotaxis protein [Rahnella aquatilis]AEX51505.1 methyl-accepting chemotaxis protein [Rahnella aquatilis CIP 78.65 = ATCC 33071]KFD16965.1 methyl-accepting chemotaxis protein I [Rahnella aquatilis CIP 78.65 = ATCC 33071]